MDDETYDKSYDVLTYPSHPYWFTHPDHLAVLARLYGVETAPVAKSRILELGSGMGGNILPIAATLPEASVAAIEQSTRQSGEAEAIAAEAGLTNIRLHCRSFADLPSDFGEFDYIIAHGLYSWVPTSLRSELLRVCARHLAPNGVLYISFNVFPGWSQPWMLRHIMRYHTAAEPDPRQKEIMSLELLERMAAAGEPGSAQTAFLAQELAFLKAQHPGYLAHDHLAADNQPVFFYDFMNQAESVGLSYLATAFRQLMAHELWPKAMAETMLGQHDPVRQQQYLDFVGGARFRAVILRHSEVPRREEPDPAAFTGFWLRMAENTRWVPLEGNEGRGGLSGTAGNVLPLPTSAAEAAVLSLLEVEPRSLSWDALVDAVTARLRHGAEVGGVSTDRIPGELAFLPMQMVWLYMLGGIDAFTRDPATGFPGDRARPHVSRFNRVLSARRGWMIDPWHRGGTTDKAAQQLVRWLDGTRTAEEVVAAVEALVASGELPLGEGWTSAREMAESGLDGLHQQGFLLPADTAD